VITTKYCPAKPRELSRFLGEGKMNRIVLSILLAVIMSFSTGYYASASDDAKEYPSCSQCGMDRAKFAQSRMLIEYDDGASVATCSIHCAAIDLAVQIDKTPMKIGVGDFMSKKLIDAEKAVWVIGGEKPGVMTKNGKWAFEKRDDAERFMKENGGRIATLDEAMKASYAEMYEDTKMIREKRKMKRMHHNM
jgi:copper chaperone NosL